jgi:hypothetical protein
LDGNPDWNDSALGGTLVWDCNLFDSPVSAPRLLPQPGRIICDSGNNLDQPLPDRSMLAMIGFDPPAMPGTAAISWDVPYLLAGAAEVGCPHPVFQFSEIPCVNATINILEAPTATPTATPTQTLTPSATPTPSPTSTAVVLGMHKSTDLDDPYNIVDAANLWICVDPNPAGPGPDTPTCEYYDEPNGEIANNGNGHLVVFERLFNALNPGGVGAFEFQLKFDHKIFDIEIFHGVDLNGDGDCTDNGEDQAQDDVDACYLYQTGRIGNAPGGPGNCDFSIVTENYILFGCVSKDPDGQNPITTGPYGPEDVIATIHVSPEPDLKFRLTPGQKNGVLRTILDENCEVAGVFGDPFEGSINGGLTPGCEDLHVTLRILEGDLDLDCVVDVTDDQMVAFRYGSAFGNLLYDPWFDLEPSLKDFDVDIKDLQKVFGRNGSTCDEPFPAQPAQQGGGFLGNPNPGLPP